MGQQKIAIFGASGHGRVVADIAVCTGWNVHFYDDAIPEKEMTLGMPYGGNFQNLISNVDQYSAAFVAIGNNRLRLSLQQSLLDAGFYIPTLVHPSSTISRFASIESGTVVMPGAVINAAAHVGCACIINTGASIDHDCLLEDGVHISPGAHLAGIVSVGKCSWIGIGASIRQQVRIGINVTVAAGAVVVKNVEDNATVAGVPAVKMR
ncbi:NeuD/PglB/VioB family sugar acetyltransferase [Halomonas alkaliantarctica]|uniref:NeuD/PglB/VioB family sugar acetyltransferase n=1 Tax=Halomonas alkaliantarctica TaxID=232346 RepID=A0ABY8LQD0_9GAMM|nr:NeuD/PglB/VioB family sugar acetyltransferase [Halomonas alkaliantarctica]WGI26635.1 NeuD/PglB/VioB family sugar acetyltransferase [Halomonas alkaliantarctica]